MREFVSYLVHRFGTSRNKGGNLGSVQREHLDIENNRELPLLVHEKNVDPTKPNIDETYYFLATQFEQRR